MQDNDLINHVEPSQAVASESLNMGRIDGKQSSIETTEYDDARPSFGANKLEQLQAIAAERGGKCLSTEYRGALHKLKWECKEGHVWETTPSVILSGSWCRTCAHNSRRGNIEQYRQIATARGGECLSTTYVNSSTKLKFKCEKGHIWEAEPNNIQQGQWCRICAMEEVAANNRDSLESYQQLAVARGGKCLSEAYKNQHSKLKFECALGHAWEALPQTIKRGSWCPECSAGLGERITREFFQQVFKAKFPISYPEWLVNAEGNRLELDGYCESLGLAFEHHGDQHYSEKSYFIDSDEKFQKRQRDDVIKAKLCEEHNVKLIIIPEVPRLTPFDQVKDLIKKESDRLGVPLPTDFDALTVNYLKAYQPDRLKELQQIAEARGGKLKSEHYLGTTEKLLFECKNQHEFWASPVSIARQGTWCRLCATEQTAKKLYASLDDVREIAVSKGGVCLSDEYFGAHRKYRFRCHRGHEWEASRANIISGKWCPFCADLASGERTRGLDLKNPEGKRGLERCRELAEQRNGQCLSDSYISAKSPMRWKCNKDGHEWEACFDSIRRGSWCPHPEHNGGVRLTLEIAQARAHDHGGECLSTEYINHKTKMRWRCHEGHEWEDTLNHITNGRWCRQCRSA